MFPVAGLGLVGVFSRGDLGVVACSIDQPIKRAGTGNGGREDNRIPCVIHGDDLYVGQSKKENVHADRHRRSQGPVCRVNPSRRGGGGY